MQIVLVLIILMVFGENSFAQQGPCLDPMFPPQPGYSCPPEYNPVCGCDGVTYRNPCTATSLMGLQYYSDGSCESFDFDFLPTYTADILNLEVYIKKSGYVIVNVFNVYGILRIQTVPFISEGLPAYEYPIEVTGLETGIFLIEIINGNESKVKKFFKN